jgi:DNA-binding PadR family transcriptional regulator
MENEKPNYYAVIPANVRYDENLKLGEKMMFGEITSLANKTGVCYASNNYFANLYKVTPQAISKWIKALEKNNYITISYEKEGKLTTRRIVKIVQSEVSTDIDTINSSLEGYQQEIKENNTSINNKENIYKKEYFSNKELNDTFLEFLEVRKKKKAVNTPRAINILIKKLNNYDDKTKLELINRSIINSWKDIYITNNKEITSKKKYNDLN